MQLEKKARKKNPRQQPSIIIIHVPSSHRCTNATTCMHTARSAPVGSMSARKPHQRLAGRAAVTPATPCAANPIPALWTPEQGSTRGRMQGAMIHPRHPARVCEAPIAAGCADAIHKPCSSRWRSPPGRERPLRRSSTCGSGTARERATQTSGVPFRIG